MNIDDTIKALATRIRQKQLLVFMAIYECRNISAAAEQIALTQSTLSKSLTEMEDALQMKLFVRLPRGVTPTPEGDVFYRHCKLLKNQYKQAAEELVRLSSPDAGHLVIACGHVWDSLMARTIAEFKSRFPATTVRMHFVADVDAINGLLKAEYDLIFGRLFDEGKHPPLIQETVFFDPNCLLVHHDHPASTTEKLELTELLDFIWLVPLPNALMRRKFDQMFFDLDLPLPTNVIECSSMLTARSLLKEVQGLICIPPMAAFKQEVEQGVFKVLSTAGPNTRIPVGFTTRSDVIASEAVGKFQQILRTIARQDGL
jgi:DNA-binding transcriptional LysR family regulator